MTGLNIYLNKKGQKIILPLAGAFSLPSVLFIYTPWKESAHRIAQNCSRPLLWSLIPPSRQRRLIEWERCKKAHATGMQVFLQANVSVNPKQQALELVFCFWGTHSSSPGPIPPLSVSRVSLRTAASALRCISLFPQSTTYSLDFDNKAPDSFHPCVCGYVHGTHVCEPRCIYISLK